MSADSRRYPAGIRRVSATHRGEPGPLQGPALTYTPGRGHERVQVAVRGGARSGPDTRGLCAARVRAAGQGDLLRDGGDAGAGLGGGEDGAAVKLLAG